ncbi:MAG TPA: helix-turn-helix domain-containing protein [Smithellaceae bacterium]|mgnify:CR=1 FL=1|nr:helix-turn-helix domain-containing protein [Smithellaceae bacterium]
MFHFTDEVDWTLFFRFDKRWIENMNWARISPAAKAVFPVIACHCNERGESFPGAEVISAKAGLTIGSVRKGIHDLENFPGFKWEYYTTRRGKRGKRFFVKFPDKGEQGRTFFFYRGIMDGGIWRKLKPAARALYPVMRYFARYEDGEDEGLDEIDEFKDRFAARKWELCNALVIELADNAGIDRRTIKDALKSLEENFLIEPYEIETGEKAYKVFIIPHSQWKARYSNQQIRSGETL